MPKRPVMSRSFYLKTIQNHKKQKSLTYSIMVCAKALLQKCRIYFLDKSKEMDIFIDASIAEIN